MTTVESIQQPRPLISLRNHLRWWLMPGFDLFTRRRVRLCRYWHSGPRRVLDAGSGNGWFSYLAYASGATVTAVNFMSDQVDKAIAFYNGWKQIPASEIQFLQSNLYDVGSLEPGFDEIICYETLEHIKDDRKVCSSFWRLLKPGGVLHLCCPNADHSHWREEELDAAEIGGHVRAGYTLESYRALLEPIGFRITDIEGMGGPVLVALGKWHRRYHGRAPIRAALLALAALPFVWLDPRRHVCAYSLYVKAVKPAPLT